MASMPETSEDSRDPEFERVLDLLIDHLDTHINRGIFILNGKVEKYKKSSDYDRYKCASLFLLNAGVSLVSYKKYYKPINLQTKDVVILYRTIFEGILNSLYVLSSDVEVSKKAIRHAQQKKYRDHDLVQKLGPYTVSLTGQPLPGEIRKLIDEFSSNKGRELNWTTHSGRQKIQIIADKYGDHIWLTLGQSYLTYYRYSSEYIHSSLFSVIDFVGKRDKDEFYEDMKTTLWTCLVEIGSSVIALLDVLRIETDIKEFEAASKETSEILLEVCDIVGKGQARDGD